jgi:hypothetical protein
MSQRVATALRSLVQARAGCRCEYCLIHEEDAHFSHQPDHVIAQKHRGPTHESDEACWYLGVLLEKAYLQAWRGVPLTVRDRPVERIWELIGRACWLPLACRAPSARSSR